jgi:hypothetical protein
MNEDRYCFGENIVQSTSDFSWQFPRIVLVFHAVNDKFKPNVKCFLIG